MAVCQSLPWMQVLTFLYVVRSTCLAPLHTDCRHYHYHHPSHLLLVFFHYQLPRPVCCPTLPAQLTTCVPLRGTHTCSLVLCKSTCGQQQVLWWSRDCQCGCDTVRVPQSHIGQKSFAWHRVGSHGRCLNLQLSDSMELAVRFGIASLLLEEVTDSGVLIQHFSYLWTITCTEYLVNYTCYSKM